MPPTHPLHRYIAIISSLLFFLGFSCSAQNITTAPAKPEKYESAWKAIDSLTNNGLTQSALTVVDTVYKKAASAANADQMIKAIVYRMRFESVREEDAFVKAIDRLNEELKTATFPVAPVLHSMLAEGYLHYYQDNRWRFADRTQTVKFEPKDIRTWDLKTIMEAMTAEYELSLKNADDHKKTRLDLYDEVIDNRYSDGSLRPTLYDFLAHRAVDFFSGDEGDFTRPAFEFTLNSADYFRPFDEFAGLSIVTRDTSSLKYRALCILQGLIAFHEKDRNAAALVDVDLKRLAFVRQRAVVSGKDSLYLHALEKLQKRFSSDPASTEVIHQIALLYHEWAATWQHKVAEQYRWMNREALALCKAAQRAFPQSYGARECTDLESRIREKSMNFTIEYVNVPDKPFKAMMKYKNVLHVYWRQVAIKLEDYQKLMVRSYDNDSLVMALVKLKPVKTWSALVPDPGDYQKHSVELDVPAAPPGHYLIIAASDPDFKVANQAICYGTTQISTISYIDRNEKDGGHEFFILDRLSGSSMKGVSARAWVQVYDEKSRNYKKVLQGTYLSDAGGHVSIPPQSNNYTNCTVEFIYGKDRLFLDDSYYLYRYGRPSKQTTPVTYFFTDRAIYRPGQAIYFKGIMLRTDGDKNEITPGVGTTVRFYNVNHQEVAHLDLTSNAYGSVHGSFTAPGGTLNGQMCITDNSGAQACFSVEEYKRPRFEVTVNQFKGTKRLGETVRLEGRAKAYAGSAIDGAKVTYRIVRQARFPNWWWCSWRPAQWSSEMEIANGAVVTNDTGGFFVDFAAIPDPSIPKSENPVFSYTGYFDVTDMTGETRSTVGSVSVGYVSLTLGVDVPQQVNKETAGTFAISTANLNGTFEPAKGSIVIYKLKTPSKVYRTQSWGVPDTQAMARSRHDELFPQDQYDDELNITGWAKGDKVFETAFDTDKEKTLAIKKISGWQQGAYILEGTTKDGAGNAVKDIRYFTLYSASEKTVPYPLADWYVPIKEQCEPGEKASFLIGSGYENVQVLYEIEHKNTVITREWIRLSNGQKRIEIPIEEKHRGNLGYHLTFIHGNRSFQHTGVITVPWTNKMLDISFETFRDKLAPGEKEEWRLKIAGKNKDKIAAEMVATLYDASLDAFRAQSWYFSIWPGYGPNRQWSVTRCFETQDASVHADGWNNYPGSPGRSYPYLNWFGYSFEGSYYGYGYGGGYRDGPVYEMAASMKMSEEKSLAPRSAPAPVVAREKKAGAKSKSAADKGELVGNLMLGDEPGASLPVPKKELSQEDLSKVSARTNLNETAFFYPQLATNENGEIIIKFQIPEALTKWKMLGFAHTKDLKYGQCTKDLVTQKDLMVTPNLPRFFRENDKITLTAKVSNMADKDLSGTAQLMLFDAATAKPVDAEFKNNAAQVSFTAKKGQSAPLAWDLLIPEGVGAVSVRVVAKSGTFSDGEEQIVPVLSSRMLVTEAMPLPIRKKETKKFTFAKLVSQNNNSTTLRNYKLTLEFTSNPAWYAIQALPYMMEYPYECAEQTFARFYANSIASSIANSSPRIKQVFDAWKTSQPEALLSNLEKNQELKSLVLEETPWLLDGKDESERKKRVALLFDLNKMGNEKERALTRLKKLQLGNGGWPWFEGMPDDRYITQYIAIGMGRLDHLGSINLRKDGTLWDMMQRCLRYLDDRTREDYEEILESIKRHGGSLDSNHLGEIQIQYLYTRSYFKDVEVSPNNKKAFDYFLGQTKRFWLQSSRYMQGMIALELVRNGDKEIAPKIMRSLKENSLTSEEMGMYWKEMYEGRRYWWWYQAPIESQALMVEAFDEVSHDTTSVEDLKAWLLKSKQTQNWETTRATAEACYALLLRGTKWLDRPSTVSIALGDVTISAAKPGTASPEAGTGYFKTSWSGSDIKPAMGNITVTKGEAGVAWGAVYWQYFEQLDKITPHETPLKLTKQLFLEQNSPTGPKISPITAGTPLRPGDKIKVRIELRVDRDMEYVHMKDMRASGLEPLNVFSGYRWQDGLGYYESTRDAATNFFFSSLHKGTFVFEYPLTVTHAGDFSNGITTIQCMYAPEFTSQSEGVRVKVNK